MIPHVDVFPREASEVASVDQLESNLAGLIAQMAGCPTHQRHKVVTVFVDHVTDFSHIHFWKSISAEETVEGTAI